jgi:hypothetical protein
MLRKGKCGWFRTCKKCGRSFKATESIRGKRKILTRNGLKGRLRSLCKRCYKKSAEDRIKIMKETMSKRKEPDMRRYNNGNKEVWRTKKDAKKG